MFSLSSVTSDVQVQLEIVADKNLLPWGESKFESM